jgi:hypothetical protein
VSDAYAHCKLIGYTADALPFIKRAGIMAEDMDYDLIELSDKASAKSLLETCAQLRLWNGGLKVTWTPKASSPRKAPPDEPRECRQRSALPCPGNQGCEAFDAVASLSIALAPAMQSGFARRSIPFQTRACDGVAPLFRLTSKPLPGHCTVD